MTKRTPHIAFGVIDFDASVKDYSARLRAEPVVVIAGRYALWRTAELNFSISCKPGLAAGFRHIGFEDPNEPGFYEEVDGNGITWEYFSAAAQDDEIKEKFGL